jgi:hypothetical protein
MTFPAGESISFLDDVFVASYCDLDLEIEPNLVP